MHAWLNFFSSAYRRPHGSSCRFDFSGRANRAVLKFQPPSRKKIKKVHPAYAKFPSFRKYAVSWCFIWESQKLSGRTSRPGFANGNARPIWRRIRTSEPPVALLWGYVCFRFRYCFGSFTRKSGLLGADFNWLDPPGHIDILTRRLWHPCFPSGLYNYICREQWYTRKNEPRIAPAIRGVCPYTGVWVFRNPKLTLGLGNHENPWDMWWNTKPFSRFKGPLPSQN